MSTPIQDDRWNAIKPLLERGAKLIHEKEILIEALDAAENMLDQIRHQRDLDNETWDAIDKVVDQARAVLAKVDP